MHPHDKHDGGRRGRRGHRFGGRFEGFAREMSEALGEQFADGFGRGPRRGGPGGGFGGGFGRRRVFDAGELRLVLLKLVEETPRHGYELIKAIETASGGVYTPSAGMVYPTLTLLADQGLVDEVADGARKRFAITAAGLRALADAAEAVATAMARLDELARLRAPTDAAPIRRALRNLHIAVHNRLGEGRGEGSNEGDSDAGRDIALNVAAILDEAAGRIERL